MSVTPIKFSSLNSSILAMSNVSAGGSNTMIVPFTVNGILDVTGPVTATGTVTAPAFAGNATSATTAAACSGNAATATNLASGNPNIAVGTVTATGTVTAPAFAASNVTASGRFSACNATFSNIDFVGSLTQNGTAFVSAGGGGGISSNNNIIVTSNLTVTNSLTLGTNTVGFGQGTQAQITAQTWSFMQNYVYSATGATNSPSITRALFTGIASQHSAFVQDGSVYTYGLNTNGQLGQGNSNQPYTLPTLVPGLSNVKAVTCGANFTVVLTASGAAFAMGGNDRGQLGDGTVVDRWSPTLVVNPSAPSSPITAVSAGLNHTLFACGSNGTVFGYGNNAVGQLGNAAINPINATALQVAVPFPAATTYASSNAVMQIDAGASHSVLCLYNGSAYVFGQNNYCQLGLPATTAFVSTPTAISSATPIVGAAAGWFHTLYATYSGAIYAAGLNTFGQCGTGSTASPVLAFTLAVAGTAGASNQQPILAAGQNHSLLLKTDGSIWTFGDNQYGQCGLGTSSSTVLTPSRLLMQYSAPATGYGIAAGANHSAFLLNNDATVPQKNRIVSCGYNNYGQVGNAMYSPNAIAATVTTPVAISDGSMIYRKSLHVGGNANMSAYVDTDGTVYAWGNNGNGQLGDGTSTNRSVSSPIAFFNFNNGARIVALAAGDSHTLALDTAGQVHAFGYNYYGQLGNNSTTDSQVPINVSSFGSLSGKTIVALAAGYSHTLALDTAGQVHAFGYNVYGQLGNNSTTDSQVPIYVTGFGTLASASTTAPVAVAFTPFFVNFTGQHRVFVAGETASSLGGGKSEGFIVVCDQDDYITASGDAPLGKFTRGQAAITINDALPVVSLAKKAYDKRVFGVLSSTVITPTAQTAYGTQRLAECGDVRQQVNAVGEGAIWVSDFSGPLVSGDLVTSSSLPGYGQLQATDDAFHGYTVAKVTCDCDFTAPQQPVYRIQVDADGLNVTDATTGHPVWVPATRTVYVDAATGLVVVPPVDPRVADASKVELVAREEPVTEAKYQMRYLDADGEQTSEAEYAKRVAEGVPAYRAAFVGCTYHCG